MDFYAISALSNATVSFVLGLFVFSKSRNLILNKVFALFCFNLFVWSICYFFWQTSETYNEALLWSRGLMAAAIFIPIVYLHFLFVLTDKIKENKKKLIIGYGVFFFFFLFSFNSLFVKDVVPKLSFPFWPNPGPLYHPFIILWIICVLYFTSFLWRQMMSSSGIKKTQLKYIFIATIIGFSGGITNYLLWYNIPVSPFANIAISVYIFIIFYAIARYRFMDIRFALSRGIIYLLSLIIVIIFAFLTLLLSNKYLSVIPLGVIESFVLIISVLIFHPILHQLEKIASKYFHYTFYDYKSVFSDLSKKLTQIINLEQLSSLITDTLSDTMKIDRVVILLRNEETGEYRIQKNIGFKEENGISLVKDNFLTDFLNKNKKPLVYEELDLMIKGVVDQDEKNKIDKLKNNMKRIEANLCLPLIIKDKIMGMIVLGNKVSRDPYFEQDVNLLQDLASQASIALQNAALYSKVTDLSQNLEKKVEEQIKELKKAYKNLEKAYKKLQSMDHAKTEFMSIVSHQLRTPLSIMKGYISMILEGTYSESTKKTKQVLENVYETNNRLISLVNDVLNVSRIQAGRVQINFEKKKVQEVIENAVSKMASPAQDKNIKLIFNKPEKEIPEINIDDNKIENILINLIDNAIKYTPQGSITVDLRKDRKHVIIEVKDTGDGMTKNEISKIFETFRRGEAGQKFWTEGAGLGLYIAKQFVAMHKGEITANSQGKNKGSVFYIKLPIK